MGERKSEDKRKKRKKMETQLDRIEINYIVRVDEGWTDKISARYGKKRKRDMD